MDYLKHHLKAEVDWMRQRRFTKQRMGMRFVRAKKIIFGDIPQAKVTAQDWQVFQYVVKNRRTPWG